MHEAAKLKRYAPERTVPKLKADRKFMLQTVRLHSLEHAAHEHKADREIALGAVKQHGCALEYAAPSSRRTVSSCSKSEGTHATQLGGPPGGGGEMGRANRST